MRKLTNITTKKNGDIAMIKHKKTSIIVISLIVLFALVICGLSFANGKSKPFKNMQSNEIDKIMVVSYKLKTTKLLSSDEIYDVVNYLKKVSINEDTNIVMDESQLDILGSIIVYFNDSSMKEIYFQKDIIGIDDNWYTGSVKSSTSFDELYNSLKGEEQPWNRN